MSWCHTCTKRFHYRGIARHRAMHRDRKEDCTITLKSGTWIYEYAEVRATVSEEVHAISSTTNQAKPATGKLSSHE